MSWVKLDDKLPGHRKTTSIDKPPPKWIYFGCDGDARPMAGIISGAWMRWRRKQKRERRKAKRQRVIDRDGMVCQLCGGDVEDRADLHIDHIIPLVRSGGSELSNLQVTHAACNLLKGAQ